MDPVVTNENVQLDIINNNTIYGGSYNMYVNQIKNDTPLHPVWQLVLTVMFFSKQPSVPFTNCKQVNTHIHPSKHEKTKSRETDFLNSGKYEGCWAHFGSDFKAGKSWRKSHAIKLSITPWQRDLKEGIHVPSQTQLWNNWSTIYSLYCVKRLRS